MTSTRESFRASERGTAPVRDSWGGRALRLLGWSTVLGSFATMAIDGASRVVTMTGSTLQANGNVGGLVGVAIFAAAVLSGGLGVLRTLRFRVASAFGLFLLLVIAWWVVCALVFRRDPVDQEQAVFILGAAVIAAAVIADPPTLKTLHSFNVIRDFAAVAMLATSLLLPASAQLPCREDKCGVFGSLYTGFFFSENAAAMLVVFMVPAAVTIASGRRFIASLGLAALLVLATGSRTALLTLVVVVVFVVTHRQTMVADRPRRVGWYWRFLPLGLLAASTYVFLTSSGSEFTGRGFIFAAIRDQLDGYAWFFGTGPSTMKEAFQSRVLGFDVVGEHGMASHLLVQTGLVGFLLFLLAMVILASDGRLWHPAHIAALGLLVAASLQSITEPGWMFTPRNINFTSMLLALGLFQAGLPPASPLDGRARPSRARAHPGHPVTVTASDSSATTSRLGLKARDGTR